MLTNPSDIIARKRAELGLSMEDAAKIAGISRQGWYIIERGTIQNPTLETAYGIARALQCEIAQIWDWAKPRGSSA